MTIRKEFETLPRKYVRLIWSEWLRWHTIDPNNVAVPGFIELDSDARRISYLAYDLNDDGKIYVAPGGEQASKSVRVVQLEARPSEFPEVV